MHRFPAKCELCQDLSKDPGTETNIHVFTVNSLLWLTAAETASIHRSLYNQAQSSGAGQSVSLLTHLKRVCCWLWINMLCVNRLSQTNVGHLGMNPRGESMTLWLCIWLHISYTGWYVTECQSFNPMLFGFFDFAIIDYKWSRSTCMYL